MASEEGEGGGPGLLETIFATLFDFLSAAFFGFFKILGKVIPFVLWVIAAIIILPCVFVAGNLYPKWEKWGEEF